MRMPWLRPILLLVAWLAASGAQADIFRPAYLELRETGADTYAVLWKVPALGDRRLRAEVQFPEGTRKLGEPLGRFEGGAYIERFEIERAGGLTGQEISIDGILGGVTDVIVRVERADGTSQLERLLPENARFTIAAPAGTGEVAWSYLVLGVEHILGGIDHLLFVLALLLIVRGGRRIILTVTAFTVAHSITLVAATLGWVHVPGPPVEAMIALSIVFVAAEVVHGLQGRPGITARAPWVVAFSFGLLHGFGFAGALAEVGLPQKAIPVALLMFNVGVEIGQLIFVAAALAVGALIARLPAAAPAVDGLRGAVRDRRGRDVLGHRADRRLRLTPGPPGYHAAMTDTRLVRAAYERALTFMRAGDGAMAEQLCRDALAENPGEPNLSSLLGAALNRQGRGAEAEPLLRRALVELPQYAKGHEELGRALLQTGRVDEAIGLLHQAVALDPKLTVRAACPGARARGGRPDSRCGRSDAGLPARGPGTRTAGAGGGVSPDRKTGGSRRRSTARSCSATPSTSRRCGCSRWSRSTPSTMARPKSS